VDRRDVDVAPVRGGAFGAPREPHRERRVGQGREARTRGHEHQGARRVIRLVPGRDRRRREDGYGHDEQTEEEETEEGRRRRGIERPGEPGRFFHGHSERSEAEPRACPEQSRRGQFSDMVKAGKLSLRSVASYRLSRSDRTRRPRSG